ncbi:MAG: hypothetical protein K2W92_07675 [Alphaproteobacteria bacterium]|nr:hypothetical protein [Alphaproteobacteria bacterium]
MITILNQDFSYEVFLDWLPDLIGCSGTLIILIIYALLQIGKVKPNSFSFPFFNLVGALMILISLIYTWNFAAAMMEVAWIIISLFGVVKVSFSKLILTGSSSLDKEEKMSFEGQ